MVICRNRIRLVLKHALHVGPFVHRPEHDKESPFVNGANQGGESPLPLEVYVLAPIAERKGTRLLDPTL